jgi:hypothetical protein
MDASIFAEWLSRQGHRVIKTASSYWYEGGPRVFQAFPYHWIIRPTEWELLELLEGRGALGLRYSTDLSSPQGFASYHVVNDCQSSNLSALAIKVRYRVRQGLRSGSVTPISLARLAKEGWEGRADTLGRQNRERAESRAWWEKLCLSAEDLPGFEAWAVIMEGQVAASILAFTCDSVCNILYQQSKTEFLRRGVNNALTFVFTSEVLKRPGIQQVFYGLHSLDAPPTVDEFKFHMGYTVRPVRQRVVFHPWISLLVNPTTHALVRQTRRLQPGSPMLAKLEGMMRFHLEGRRPLGEQPWPEALRLQKGQILGSHVG